MSAPKPWVWVLFYPNMKLYFSCPQIKEGLLATRDKLKIGDPAEFDTFAAAVIDKKAFDRISGYIKHAKSSSNLEILGGGQYDER